MMDDQERISDELQLLSISLHALTELAGQVLSCKDDPDQRAYFLNYSLPKMLDSMQCLSSRLDDISAFIKEGKIND